MACEEVLLGFELFHGTHQWDAKPNFNINQRSTGNVTVSLGIKIKGEGVSSTLCTHTYIILNRLLVFIWVYCLVYCIVKFLICRQPIPTDNP